MFRYKARLILLVAWTAAVLLVSYAMKGALDERLKEHWFYIAGTVVSAITLLVMFLRWVYQLAIKSEMPLVAVSPNAENNIELVKGKFPMPDNPTTDNRTVHINHGPSYHNTSGGMMNFGPVTVHQNFGASNNGTEAAQDNLHERDAEVITDNETIDIGDLIDFSEKLKSPGVSRNTIDNILKRANIKPCKTEKDGRTIRNLYPREESQSAVAAYLADRDK